MVCADYKILEKTVTIKCTSDLICIQVVFINVSSLITKFLSNQKLLMRKYFFVLGTYTKFDTNISDNKKVPKSLTRKVCTTPSPSGVTGSK